jgi:imidazolonepropionase-like amidohydrolase
LRVLTLQQVAKELADADIPLILSEDRPAPDLFRDKDAVIGPPLSRSVASYLAEAGVKFALAVVAPDMPADFRIHELGPDAGWTRKYAGLTDDETVRLVTTNVEEILGLPPSGDLVVFEGDPLRFGASVVLAFHGDGRGGVELATCFPREADYGPRLG